MTDILNALNHLEFVSLNNQKCMTQLLLSIYILTNTLHCYPFVVNLDRCVGSCNTLDCLSNKACVSNKTEDLNLSVFNMITGIIESKTLITQISCECKYNFDSKNVTQIKSGIAINVDVSVKI